MLFPTIEQLRNGTFKDDSGQVKPIFEIVVVPGLDSDAKELDYDW